MRLLVIVLPLVLIRPALAEPMTGDDGTPQFEKAAGLVLQLGHKQFAVREAAAKKLIEMGSSAIPALQAGTKSPDEEVRTRCTALIPKVKAADWARRADDYLARPDARHELPLLADWDKLMGLPDTSSRKLFAEIVRANGEFLDTVARDRKQATTLSAARSKTILDNVQSPKGQLKAELSDLAAVLFVDTLAPTPLTVSETVPPYLLTNPGMIESLSGAETGPALRRLLVGWAGAQPAYSPVAKIKFADLARRKPFPEAVPVLAKLATDKTNRVLVMKLLAIEALGIAGGKDAAAALAGFVPDSSAILRWGNPDGREEPQFGDQALAASLILHGRKAKDYGFTENKLDFVSPVGNWKIPMIVYGFQDKETRAKAVKHWQAEVMSKSNQKK